MIGGEHEYELAISNVITIHPSTSVEGVFFCFAIGSGCMANEVAYVDLVGYGNVLFVTVS